MLLWDIIVIFIDFEIYDKVLDGVFKWGVDCI